MRLVTSSAELMEVLHGGGVASRRPVFVPTMGALHAGHASLIHHAVAIRAASVDGGPVVVSVFVNPTQFNDPADLDRYPRTLQADAAACRDAGADIVYAPGVDDVYPPGQEIKVPPLPAVATRPGLEDALRPGHFAGVCQVVARLFALVEPAVAVFGEKDWQQLRVISAMVGETGLPRIVGVPTRREADGLAMSSRNVFLTPSERSLAAAVPGALRAARAAATPIEAEQFMQRMLGDAGLEIQYAVVRDASTLQQPRPGEICRALIAVRLGAIRLIDNAAWPGEKGSL